MISVTKESSTMEELKIDELSRLETYPCDEIGAIMMMNRDDGDDNDDLKINTDNNGMI